MRILQATEQQMLTTPQAIQQLEAATASRHKPGIVATYRQTIERLRRQQKGTA